MRLLPWEFIRFFSSLKNHKFCSQPQFLCCPLLPHSHKAPRFHTYFRPNPVIHYLSPHIFSRVTRGRISPQLHQWDEIHISANAPSHISRCCFFNVRIAHLYIYSKTNLINEDILTRLCLSLLKGWAEPTVEWIHSSAVFLWWIMLLVPCVTHLTDSWRVFETGHF